MGEKKYLIKSHTGTEGRGRGTRLPERQIEWLRSMRVPHVRHVFSWVNQTLHLLGGNWRASWERWPLLCSASGPPSAVWACSNWHSISPSSWGCTCVDYRLAMLLSLNHHQDFLISLEYDINEVINDSLFSAARTEFKTFRKHEFLFQFHERSCLINNKLLIRPVIDKAKPLDIYIPTRDTSAKEVRLVSCAVSPCPPISLNVCVGGGLHWRHMVGPWLWQTDTLVIDGSQPLRW